MAAGESGQEATQSFPGRREDATLRDVLAPAQQPGEIGRLGPYRVLQVLGVGGMGVVFKAIDPNLQRPVALKTMLAARASNPAAKERFEREARAAAALKHPHIVTIFHVGEDRGIPFLAMELLEGEPLAERLKRDTSLGVPEILRIGRETAAGLAAAHEAGLIHRDIKPANIWLETNPMRRGAPSPPGVKILDFGLVRAIGSASHLSQAGDIIGTPAYMAPEQAAGEAVDPRCDLFSLGCVLYRLCTGRTPFKGNDTVSILLAIATEDPPPPGKINPAVPPGLSDLIMRLLAKRPEERPGSARVVEEALWKFEEQLAPIPLTAAGRNTWSQTFWFVGGSMVGAGLLGLVLMWLSRSGDDQANPAPKRPVAAGKTSEALKYTNNVGMDFVLVPAGRSWLGGGGGKAGERAVTVLRDFYLGTYEVTQEEWEKVTGSNPSHFAPTGSGKEAVKNLADADRQKLPVENVSWQDVQLFLAQLNERDPQAGWVYRLPTAAEWEYACRGGPLESHDESAFDFYVDKPAAELLPEQANFAHAAGLKQTRKVGSYPPNRLGLYDMHGNVFEWCHDFADPKGWDPNGLWKGQPGHVNRGGSWLHLVDWTSAARLSAGPESLHDFNLGLRVARVPSGKEVVAGDGPDAAAVAVPREKAAVLAPFVVLARADRPERTFRHLTDAVAAAASGDTIEVRGNGPFVLSPIALEAKALALRAGPGCRPVLLLAAQAVADDLPLLTTAAALALEGLDFRRQGSGKEPHGVKFIRSTGGPLAVAHCRFVYSMPRRTWVHPLWAEGPLVDVRHCEFLGD